MYACLVEAFGAIVPLCNLVAEISRNDLDPR